MKLVIEIDENIRVAISRMGLLRIPDEMQKKVDKAIQHGTPIEQEPKTEWVPVSETIPIIETDVLLTSWNGKAEYVGWIDAFGKWHSDDAEVIDGYEPLAWMPLPEPYKEG